MAAFSTNASAVHLSLAEVNPGASRRTPRTRHDPVAARLVDPALTRSLLRYLATKRIPAGEADEILDVARMQLFERGLPRTSAEVAPLLFRIAHRRAMDWHREMEAMPGASACERAASRRPRLPVEPPSAPVEAEQAVEELGLLAAENHRHSLALEAMKQKMAGTSLDTFAADRGVAAGTLRQWMNRFRMHARKRLPQYVEQF